MKIKTYLNNLIAIIAIIALVGGFQISSGSEVNATSLTLVESVLGVEEAYAGPCGRRGCDGTNQYCTTYTVMEIGGIHVVRHCDGARSNNDELQQLN